MLVTMLVFVITSEVIFKGGRGGRGGRGSRGGGGHYGNRLLIVCFAICAQPYITA